MNALDIAPHIAQTIPLSLIPSFSSYQKLEVSPLLVAVQAISLTLFFTILVAISVIDWKERRIPNKLLLTLLALRLSFACASGLDIETIVFSFVLSFGCAGVLLLSKLLMDRISSKDSLGLGDIKLVAVGFAFSSLDQAMLALFIACVSALLLAVYFCKAHGDSTFPFGPPLCLSIIVTFFA